MIRVEGLRVTAGDFELRVDELSLEAGEFLVVLGPTGSGKTVLLETLAGLRRPQAGQIWFGDREVTAEPPERRRVGFVYQDYALFPHLTVAQNIAFGLRGRGPKVDVKDTVGRLAALLGIEALLGRYPAGLSGGEQQRVALARALAIEPDVLLLDEPLSALDHQTRLELRAEIKRLYRELGATVMYVTHDLDEGLELGDRMAVLIDGELRQTGIPKEVTRHPADPDVARLLGCPNVFPAEVAEVGVDTARIRLKTAPETADREETGGTGVELLVADGGTLGPGECCYAVIRPDEIAVSPLEPYPGPIAEAERKPTAPSEAAATNVFEGIVRGISTHSTHASLEVEVPPLLLTVHLLNPDVARVGLRPNARVRVRVPPSAVHLALPPPCPSGAEGAPVIAPTRGARGDTTTWASEVRVLPVTGERESGRYRLELARARS